MKFAHVIRILLVFISILAGATMGVAQYWITPLGIADGVPFPGMNGYGEVVGTDSAHSTALLYTSGSLNAVPGNVAAAINNTGQIAVWLYSRGYIYDRYNYKSGLVDLGDLGGGVTFPLGMNDYGYVVGESLNANQYHAFRYYGGRILDLGNLGTGIHTSMAYGINRSGVIVGQSQNDYYLWRAFLWSKGTMYDLDPSAPNYTSYAFAINDSNQVVGSSNKANCGRRGVCQGGFLYPVLYSGGSIVSLGGLGGLAGEAYGIDNLGEIVGWSTTASGARHAFLYRGGYMTDLNNYLAGFGGTLTDAYSINQSGQILCRWIAPNGNVQMVLLTPIPC